MASQNDGTETAVHDHAAHPEAGSAFREDKSFAKPRPGKDPNRDSRPGIAADDAGATAMAEATQRDNDDVEQR